MIGAGGEVHQTAGGDTPVLTTQQGIPVADDQNSLKIGARGPTALEDSHLEVLAYYRNGDQLARLQWDPHTRQARTVWRR